VPVDPAPAEYVGALLNALHVFDRRRVCTVLDEAAATHGLDVTIDEVVLPALRLVGTFWASGRMDVAHEHLLSAVVARWVAGRSVPASGSARSGTILLAAGPQDMHTLALDCLDLLLASRGVEVCNLGAQTPVASLLLAARLVNPTAVVLSSQTPTVGGGAVQSVMTMAEAGLPVYFAGSSFALQLFRQHAPGIPLDGTLRESAEMLTARHTTLLAGRVVRETEHDRRSAVARAVDLARELQVVEAAQGVTSTRHAVAAAARTAALAAAKARAGRAAAASSAADAVASRAGRAAAAVQTRADTSATTLRHAAARAATTAAAARASGGDREAARTALDVAAAARTAALAAAREAEAAAEEVATAVAAAAAHQLAVETEARAVRVAVVARAAVVAVASGLDGRVDEDGEDGQAAGP